jgi:hypothetical protein
MTPFRIHPGADHRDLTGDGLDDLVLSAPAEVRNGVAGGVYVLESPALD